MKSRILISLLCLFQCTACVALASELDAVKVIHELANAPGDQAVLNELKAVVARTTDIDQKLPLAAINCLGCYYTGQMEAASQMRAYLSKTFPSHAAIKPLSTEILCDQCGICNGTGSVSLNCHKCHGTGRCPLCQGQGQRSVLTFGGTKVERCWMCSGLGACKECAGTRKVSQRCTACAGTGSVFSRDKMEKTYIMLLRDAQGPLATQSPREHGGTPHQKNTWTVASGLGVDEESARLQALRAAVQQVVGVYLDAKTVIENDEIIKEKILDYSAGFVKDYEILQITQNAGLIEVMLKANVEHAKLQGRIRDEVKAGKRIDGVKLFSVATNELEAHQKRRELLRTVATDFPQKAVQLDIFSIDIVRPLNNGTVDLDVTVTFKLSPEFISRLQKTLAATAVKTSVLNDLTRLIPDSEYPEHVKATGVLIHGSNRRSFYELDVASYWSIVNGIITGEDWIIATWERVDQSDQWIPRLQIDLLDDNNVLLESKKLDDFVCDSNQTTGCPQYWQFSGGLLCLIYQIPYHAGISRDLSSRFGSPYTNKYVYETPLPDTKLEKQLILQIFPGRQTSRVYRINIKSELLKKMVRIRPYYICPLKDKNAM